MARSLLQTWRISPDVSVAVDDATCIVLTTPERTITVSNVDTLKRALDLARQYVQVREAVIADWRDDPAQGEAILQAMAWE